jgi:hypothetical protein
MGQQIVLKLLSVKFNKNPFCGSRVLSCVQTETGGFYYTLRSVADMSVVIPSAESSVRVETVYFYNVFKGNQTLCVEYALIKKIKMSVYKRTFVEQIQNFSSENSFRLHAKKNAEEEYSGLPSFPRQPPECK